MREADYLSSREVPKEEAMHIIQIKRYQSPTGEMLIGTFENRVYLCDWTKGRRRESNDRRIQKTLNAIYQEEDTELAQQVIQQLNEYFAGSRQQGDRQSQSHKSRRLRQRFQSHFHTDPMPPSHRQQSQISRLWRRNRDQTLLTGAGATQYHHQRQTNCFSAVITTGSLGVNNTYY